MKAILANKELKKALTIFKKVPKSTLNFSRVMLIRANVEGKLIIRYDNAFDRVTWYSGANYIGEDRWIDMKDLESAIHGKTTEIEATEKGLNVNGIPVEVQNALDFDIPVPTMPTIPFGNELREAYLSCLDAASTKDYEDKQPTGFQRHQLCNVCWDKNGFTGTNGKILIHVEKNGQDGDPIFIPSFPVIPAIMKAEEGKLGIAEGYDENTGRRMFAMYGEKFGYNTSRSMRSYPGYHAVMTNGYGPDFIFPDTVTPLIPAFGNKMGADDDMLCIRDNALVTKLGPNPIQMETHLNEVAGDPELKSIMLRQKFLKMCFDRGITSLRFAHRQQFWGENDGTYITFMPCAHKVDPDGKSA